MEKEYWHVDINKPCYEQGIYGLDIQEMTKVHLLECKYRAANVLKIVLKKSEHKCTCKTKRT